MLVCVNWVNTVDDDILLSDRIRLTNIMGIHIDGVTITAKIISKDGELRHDFGVVTTEDGIYTGSTT